MNYVQQLIDARLRRSATELAAQIQEDNRKNWEVFIQMANKGASPGRLKVLTEIKGSRDFSVLKAGKAYRVGGKDMLLRAVHATGLTAIFHYITVGGALTDIQVSANPKVVEILNVDGTPVEGLEKPGVTVFNSVLKVGKAYQAFMKYKGGEVIEANVIVTELTNNKVCLVFYHQCRTTGAHVTFTAEYVAEGNVKFWEVN
jgi:hypothetical protein